MADETDQRSTWQTDVVDAIKHVGDGQLLMENATGWAVRGKTAPYHVVLVAGEGSQSLKVCMVPIGYDPRIDQGLKALEERPTGPQCFFLGSKVRARAYHDPNDEMSFLYLVDTYSNGLFEFEALPCRGYRYRDTCSHVLKVPGESLAQAVDRITDEV